MYPIALTWRYKGHHTDDRVANGEDRPQNCNRFTIPDIICGVHM